MFRKLLSLTLLLSGYAFLLAGILLVIAVFYGLPPQVIYALVFGTVLAVIGFWILGKHDKLYGGKDTWKDRWKNNWRNE